MKENVVGLVKGLLRAVVLTVGSILLLSAIMLKTELPVGLQKGLMTAVYFVSLFVGAPPFVRAATGRRFFRGMIFGAVYVLLYMISAIIYGAAAGMSGSAILLLTLASIIVGMLSGMLTRT